MPNDFWGKQRVSRLQCCDAGCYHLTWRNWTHKTHGGVAIKRRDDRLREETTSGVRLKGFVHFLDPVAMEVNAVHPEREDGRPLHRSDQVVGQGPEKQQSGRMRGRQSDRAGGPTPGRRARLATYKILKLFRFRGMAGNGPTMALLLRLRLLSKPRPVEETENWVGKRVNMLWLKSLRSQGNAARERSWCQQVSTG